MSTHAFSWPAFVSTALRNELRRPDSPSPVRENYGWKDWYPNMIEAANSINEANSDPLIFFSGLGFDTDLGNVTAGTYVDECNLSDDSCVCHRLRHMLIDL